MLHRGERRTLTTKQVRETEAEAVAFVVCQARGLETGTASADYIQLWHGDAKLLRESLESCATCDGHTPTTTRNKTNEKENCHARSAEHCEQQRISKRTHRHLGGVR
jgi:hypothetical protein